MKFATAGGRDRSGLERASVWLCDPAVFSYACEVDR